MAFYYTKYLSGMWTFLDFLSSSFCAILTPSEIFLIKKKFKNCIELKTGSLKCLIWLQTKRD